MARQQSILGFVCLGPQHGGPGLEVVDVEERRRREAARLGLPWPPAKRVCRVGRPKFSDKYLDRIHALLETGDWAILARLGTAQAPAAWRPGDPIGAEEQDMENALGLAAPGSASGLDGEGAPGERSPSSENAARGATPSPQSGGKESGEAPKEKRKKVTLGKEFVSFFFEFSESMHVEKGWSQRHTWLTLREWLPELYGRVAMDTYKRWPAPSNAAGAEVTPSKRGRPRQLNASQIVRLTTMAYSLAKTGAPMDTRVMVEIANKELYPAQVSATWVREFMAGIGMLMRNTSRADKSKFSPEHIQRVQKSLKLRLHFLTQVNQIPLENVFNFAETFVAASVWWSDMRSTQFASIGGSRGGWCEFHFLLRFNTVTVVSPHLYSFGTMTTTVAFLLSAVLRAAASRSSSSSSHRLQDRCESRDAKKSLDNTLHLLG